MEEKRKELKEMDKDTDMSVESEGDDNPSNDDGDDGNTRKKVKIDS